MPRMDIDRKAPILLERQREILASAFTVWKVLSDIQQWPQWVPHVDAMNLRGPFLIGSTFQWRSGWFPIVSTLREIQKPNRLVWEGNSLGVRAVHVWAIDEDGPGQCRVTTLESMEGWAPRTFRGSLEAKTANTLDIWLDALAKRVRGEVPCE